MGRTEDLARIGGFSEGNAGHAGVASPLERHLASGLASWNEYGVSLERSRSAADTLWTIRKAARGVLRTALTQKGLTAVRRLRNGGLLRLKTKEERRFLAIARSCFEQANGLNWYDSNFLRHFEAAKKFVALICPERTQEFVAGFEPLRTNPKFQTTLVESVFDPDTFRELVEVVHGLPNLALQYHEGESFGRSLIRRHPFFTRLQSSLTERVSQLVGERVTPSYNFLSLYGGKGRCDPHLDNPVSKWTLDICIEQNVDWPIHFSQVVDWPSESAEYGTTIAELRAHPALRFESITLKPNSGAVFSGSSQWHFRDPLEAGDTAFCTLLFLHYLPEGAEALVHPQKWASHFGIPELRILAAAG